MQHFANFGTADFGIIKQQNKLKRQEFDAQGFKPSKISDILARKEKVIENYNNNPYLNPSNEIQHKSAPFFRNTSGQVQSAPKEMSARAFKDAEVRAHAKSQHEKFVNTSDYDIVKNTIEQERDDHIRQNRMVRSRDMYDPLEYFPPRKNYPDNHWHGQQVKQRRLAEPRTIFKDKEGNIGNRGVNRFDIRGGNIPK
jgi:hypothetical protein